MSTAAEIKRVSESDLDALLPLMLSLRLMPLLRAAGEAAAARVFAAALRARAIAAPALFHEAALAALGDEALESPVPLAGAAGGVAAAAAAASAAAAAP